VKRKMKQEAVGST